MSAPRRASLRALGALAILAPIAGCWVVAGVDDREVARDAGASCPNVFAQAVTAPCRACLEATCCAELGDCHASPECAACVTTGGVECPFVDSFAALGSCVKSSCAEACATGLDFPVDVEPHCNSVGSPAGECSEIGGFFHLNRCNPVTNAPCDEAAGEVCAFDLFTLVWDCHATGHTVSCDQPCGLVEGLCGPGLTCINSRCYELCCEPEDCNGLAGASCLTYQVPDGPKLGACVFDAPP